MALLSPERVPVKIYKWDDVGAPVLKKSTNSLTAIFEACLVTGYGTKPSAGWTMPYEASGIKVFRPQVGADTDFYLRCSANTTTQMTAQVYINMTDVSTGDLKLQCATPFKYARGVISGKWVLVASSRGFWFFNEQSYDLDSHELISKSGAFFFVGDTMRNTVGFRAVFLQHTGGDYNDGDYADIFGYSRGGNIKSSNSYVKGKLLDYADIVHNGEMESFFDGRTVRTRDRTLAPIIVITNNQLYQLPAMFTASDGFKDLNYTSTMMDMGGYASNALVVSTSPSLVNNSCVATEYWSY